MRRTILPRLSTHACGDIPCPAGYGGDRARGSFCGGVATLYALRARPTRFGYGSIDRPTLWIGMGQRVRETNPLVAIPVEEFDAVGGREGDNPAIIEQMVGLIRQVEQNFRAAGYDDSNVPFREWREQPQQER